jgi:outer membrane protein assembly factor BamB
MRAILVAAVCCIVLQIGFVACDWNEWAAGNNGVHSRPVYKVQPGIKWSFKHPSASLIKGVINVDDSTGRIIISNSASSQPLFWVLDKNGTVVYSFNDTESGSCAGTLSSSNGVVYVLNEVTCLVLAVDTVNNQRIWNSTDLCQATGISGGDPQSAPILIRENILYVSLGKAIIALNRTDGAIQWSYGVGSAGSTAQFMAPIYSALDDTIVTFSSLNYIIKLDAATGEEEFAVEVTAYSDSKTYPPLVDQENGFIYVASPGGIVKKYSSSAGLIWTNNFSPSTILHGPVLIGNYLIVMTNRKFYAIETATKDAVATTSGTLTIDFVKAQLLYADNVLYATDGLGNLAAYNVTDPLNFKVMWTMITSTKKIEGAGPAIALDGTIYVGSASGQADTSILVALGCTNGNILSENGTCVCPEDALIFPYKGKCLTCTDGKYFNATAGCVLCCDGLVPNVNRITCDECPEDTFSMSGDEECRPCSEQPENSQCPAVPAPISDPPNVVRAPDGQIITSGADTKFASVLILMCALIAMMRD